MNEVYCQKPENLLLMHNISTPSLSTGISTFKTSSVERVKIVTAGQMMVPTETILMTFMLSIFGTVEDGGSRVIGIHDWNQWRRKCIDCGENLLADGSILPGYTCKDTLSGMFLRPYEVNFDGFPQDSDYARREPAGCMPNTLYSCSLFCGNYRGHDMKVVYVIGQTDRVVHGLPWWADWKRACRMCGFNLEAGGFIKSGSWTCVDKWPVMVHIKYFGRYN